MNNGTVGVLLISLMLATTAHAQFDAIPQATPTEQVASYMGEVGEKLLSGLGDVAWAGPEAIATVAIVAVSFGETSDILTAVPGIPVGIVVAVTQATARTARGVLRIAFCPLAARKHRAWSWWLFGNPAAGTAQPVTYGGNGW